MDHRVYTYIQTVLGSFIRQRPCPGNLMLESADVAGVRKAASRGYIWGIVQQTVPPEHVARLDPSGGMLRSTYASYLAKEKVSAELSAILRSGKVPHAVIRGVATASSFPEPSVRISSDVDVLVPRECMEAADRLLRDNHAGFMIRLRSQMLYKLRGITIEVHERLMTPNRLAEQNAVFSDWPDHIRRVPVGNSGSICALKIEYALVADVFHAVVHHDLEKIVYVVDIACQALDQTVDWRIVDDLVRRLSIHDYFAYALGYVGWVLGDWFLDALPSGWADQAKAINPGDFEPIWQRASGSDSLKSFLARRRQIYRRTPSAKLRFRLAWRMCFGEDMKKAMLYAIGKR